VPAEHSLIASISTLNWRSSRSRRDGGRRSQSLNPERDTPSTRHISATDQTLFGSAFSSAMNDYTAVTRSWSAHFLKPLTRTNSQLFVQSGAALALCRTGQPLSALFMLRAGPRRRGGREGSSPLALAPSDVRWVSRERPGEG
jgi:hypothetical protein